MTSFTVAEMWSRTGYIALGWVGQRKQSDSCQSQDEIFQGLATHLDLTLALDWFSQLHHFLAPHVTAEASGHHLAYLFSETQLLRVHSPGCSPPPSSHSSTLVHIYNPRA